MKSPATLDFTMVVLESPGGRVLARERALPRVRVLDSEMRYRDLARGLWRAEQIAVYILDNLYLDGEYVCIARPVDTMSQLRSGLVWATERELPDGDANLLRECHRIQLSKERQTFSYRHFGALDVLPDILRWLTSGKAV